MKTDNAALRDSLAEAKYRALMVYEHDKRQPGAERAAAFALGRSEGLGAALEQLEGQMRQDVPSESSRPAGFPPAFLAVSSFASVFQKLRPKHGPSPLGRW